MPLVPESVVFPAPGTYVKYWDFTKKTFQYLRLLQYEFPLRYPRRLGSVAVGGKTDTISFRDLNPSDDKNHRYLAYLGVRPGALYYVWHPFNYLTRKWDENPTVFIQDDLTGALTAEQSPIEAPTLGLWIEHDRYPAVQALNIMDRATVPEVLWIAAKYHVQLHSEIPAHTLLHLQTEAIPSMPISFGGEL